MQERIRRVTLLIRELGYELHESTTGEDSYSSGFSTPDGFEAGFFIDGDSKFLEFAFTFAFSEALGDFIRERMEDVLHTLYEFGCYFTLHAEEGEITLTVFSKIYYAGLNYFAVKETVRDFRDALEALQDVFALELEEEGPLHGNP